MSLFSFFSRRHHASGAQAKQGKNAKRPFRSARPSFEVLEDRSVPAAHSISGYVFEDVNNNGLFDASEKPIVGSTIELRNEQNLLIGTAISDPNGFYKFDRDDTVDSTPRVITKFLEFPNTQTDFILQGLIDQFDNSLGELKEVEITHEGSITSEIRVENTSPISPSVIKGTVGGTLKLEGPGVNSVIELSENAGTFNATNYDGLKDYGGTSGNTFAAKTASGTKVVTLTGSAILPYIGTGKVTFTESAQAASFAAGGGNLDVSLSSSGKSRVTVKYKYIPNNTLQPGKYTLIQVPQPAGYVDGKESANGVVLSNPPGIDVIPVVLVNGDSIKNNFGELVTASVSGFVYHDANNNATKDANEQGIANTLVTLTGTDLFGTITPKTTTTDANGFYQFDGLNPGTYTVQETQPTQPVQWLDGKDKAGTLGGDTNINDRIANILVPSGGKSLNNNFGELKLASLSGFVYADNNNNGVKEGNEAGINGITITLSGTDYEGAAVNLTTATNASGFYQFVGLKPGTYAIAEPTQPANFHDGQDKIGSQGGLEGNEILFGIALGSGVDGINNNFGEIAFTGVSGFVYVDRDNDGIKDANEEGIQGVTVTLTGIENGGGPVLRTETTDSTGFYRFAGLRAGTYSILETQPANFRDGKDTAGSAAGDASVNDTISNIVLGVGVLATNYNFGELTPDESDLGIVKSASAASVLVGSNLTYTLTITNYGTHTAQNVKVEDVLPPDAQLLNVSGPGWTFAGVVGKIFATLPSLAVGASSQITVTIKVPAVATTMVNTTTVTSDTPDNNPNNNKSTVTTIVLNQPGEFFPKTIVPLVTAFGPITFQGKFNLIVTDYTPYVNLASHGAQTFVDGVYRTALGRAATTAERNAGVAQLQNGMTREQFTAAIWNTDEHRIYQANQFYQVFLNRNGSAAELAATAQQLKLGMSEIDIALGFVNSLEYNTLHPTPATLIGGMYRDILNRLPDLSTSILSVQSLGTQSVSQLASSLLLSQEGLANLVDDGFRAVMRRPPTAVESQFWTLQLQTKAVTPSQMMMQLMASDEFYQLAFASALKA